jgi:uncharacterized membrane protein YhaH (DUF805 family)
MGEDTSRSDAQVYTTAVTSTIGRPPRKTYFLVQGIAFAVTVGVCLVTLKYDRVLGSKEIKLPAEVLVVMSKVMSKPAGIAVGIGVCVVLGLLAIRGALDGFLKMLIWLNVLWVVLVVAVLAVTVLLPALRGQPPAAGP